MNVKELLKVKADEMVNKLKSQCLDKGKILTEFEEMYIRLGISYGLSLAAIVLGMLSSDITISRFLQRK